MSSSKKRIDRKNSVNSNNQYISDVKKYIDRSLDCYIFNMNRISQKYINEKIFNDIHINFIRFYTYKLTHIIKFKDITRSSHQTFIELSNYDNVKLFFDNLIKKENIEECENICIFCNMFSSYYCYDDCDTVCPFVISKLSQYEDVKKIILENDEILYKEYNIKCKAVTMINELIYNKESYNELLNLINPLKIINEQQI